MKFLQNRTLKQLALYLLIGMFIVFLMEYLIIRNKIETLEEIEEKKDYARSAQIEGQQLAYIIQLHILNERGLVPEIISRLSKQEHQLSILSKGGRIDDTDIFLKPLSRLPKISFNRLYDQWSEYKFNVETALADNASAEKNHAQPADSSAIERDSVIREATNTAAVNVVANQSLLAGQWLTISRWYESLLSDLTEEAENKKSSVETWFFCFIIFDVVLLASLFLLFYKYIVLPIQKLTYNAANQHQDFSLTKDEIGALTFEINEILEQLKDATEFVAAIGEGKLEFDYKTLDSHYALGKNKLADSLISMQGKLKTLNEEEQRRQWANEGLTKFVDLLRSSNDNITTLGDKIISALVKYTSSNQGGLYVLNDEDEHNKYLELVSLFAFDTKKYETQKIKLGQGILGQTFLEKETTILNEIPNDYISITSGLGGANPKSILMVPLKVDKEVYGIVELASFKYYEQHEIAFVEKLAETIASTLASVKAAQKNRHLIEQFQQQTEMMRAQEEEMRQNMEELQATQEEMSRKEQDYVSRIHDLENKIQTVSNVNDEQLKEQLRHQEQQYSSVIQSLEKKISEKPEHGDDWALAEEVEKTLRIQLEALRITKEAN
jgi:putative methionine-R-sulfoxide reductase with GAF domain/uncharacterized OsmC-like protein